MKSLLKIMAVIALFFASTFIILKSTGLITVEKIELWLETAKATNPVYVAMIITSLLFADLLIAVPTLTVIILGGYFLGPLLGSLTAILGLFLAGTVGYVISRKYGHFLLRFLVKDQNKRQDALNQFRQNCSVIILLSRATPILPEVSACMAGMTRMNFVKFLLLWLLSTVPYAILASYAGSVSTLENPKPAIYAAIAITSCFWIGWFLFKKSKRGSI